MIEMWKCQIVTACPFEKHCSVGFGPFPQTSYTFKVSSQIFLALFCILHTLVTFLVKLWKHEWDVKMSECYCMPMRKALLSWVQPFSADCIHFCSFYLDFMALFCILYTLVMFLHTLVLFLVKLWKHEGDVKMNESYCMPVQKALLSWVLPFSAGFKHFLSF